MLGAAALSPGLWSDTGDTLRQGPNQQERRERAAQPSRRREGAAGWGETPRVPHWHHCWRRPRAAVSLEWKRREVGREPHRFLTAGMQSEAGKAGLQGKLPGPGPVCCGKVLSPS